MVRRQNIVTITKQGIKNWGTNSLIPDSIFDPYLPTQGGAIKSKNFNVLFKLLQTGVNALNLHIFNSVLLNLTTTNVATTNPGDESISGGGNFQDMINRENKIRIVQNTNNIADNTADINDMKQVTDDAVLGYVLYYDGVDTIATYIRNTNDDTGVDLGSHLYVLKGRNETDPTNYQVGDTHYNILLSPTSAGILFCQNFTLTGWTSIDCPYTNNKTIVIKQILDNALAAKVSTSSVDTLSNGQGQIYYDSNSSPTISKTDLDNDTALEFKIDTGEASIKLGVNPYVATTASGIISKKVLDDNINPITQNIDTINTVNTNQNNRLNLIEASLAKASSDFSYLKQTTDVIATTSDTYVIAPTYADFDFSSGFLSYDNTTDPTIGKFTLTRSAKVIINFVGNISKIATNTIALVYELYDLDNDTVLSTDTTNFDFTTNITVENQAAILTYSFNNIDGETVTERNFAIRYRTSTGTLTTNQFKIPIDVIFTSDSSISDVVTFSQIINDTDVDGGSGQDVINNLNAQIIENTDDITDLKYDKADQVYVDAALENKVEESQIVGINTSEFGYTEGANSPYISKFDADTNRTTKLLVFANQNPVIQMLDGNTEISGEYIPTAVNEIIIKNDLDKTETKLQDQIDPIKVQADSNTSSINTLNSLVQESFTDNGAYSSPAGILNAETGEIRVVLTAIEPLNPEYVTVTTSPDPNLFINNFNGAVNFVVQFDGIQNDDTEKQLAIKIYDNISGEIVKTIEKTIPVGAYISTNVFSSVDVLEGEELYFTYSISDGAGDLTISNDIVYNIDIKSGGITTVKSSSIIDDSLDIIDAGINPWKIQLDSVIDSVSNLKSSQINDDSNDVTNLGLNNTLNNVAKLRKRTTLINNSSGINPDELITLATSYRDFNVLELRISFNSYRLIINLPAQRINVNDKTIIYNYTKGGSSGVAAYNVNVYLEWTSETEVYLRTEEADENIIRVFNITGREQT